MEPDRSSRAAARRIVEEVLADHAARGTALDDVAPVVIPERPDTEPWRAARRIVEETLAEHAARVVVPDRVGPEVIVDLQDRDVEVMLDVDGPPPAPTRAQREAREDEASPVTFGVDPAEDPPAAQPRASEDPTDAVAADAPAEAVEPDVADVADLAAEDLAAEDAGTSSEPAPVPMEDEIPAYESPDDALLRAAIPERLFGDPADEAGTDDPPDRQAVEPVDLELDEGADTPGVAPVDLEGDASDAGGSEQALPLAATPPALLDPDDPAVIAARIVAVVLAEREQARVDLAARNGSGADLETSGGSDSRDEPSPRGEESLTGEAADEAAAPVESPTRVGSSRIGPEPDHDDTAPDVGVPAASAPAARPAFEPAPDFDRPTDPGRDPEPVLATGDPGREDVGVLDPEGSDAQADRLSRDAFIDDEATVGLTPVAHPEEGLTDEGLTDADLWDADPWDADPWGEGRADGDQPNDAEFGGWPDPILPPRRTGRWLLTTVLGAVLLAFLLPLAIGALRDLVSFS